MPLSLSQFRQEMQQELQTLLQWWITHMVDAENGGFLGQRDGYNQIVPKADKAIILHTRILWTFAEAARFTGNPAYIAIADRAFAYLAKYFWDPEQGGVYWMVNYQGQVVNPRKQIYAQAFAIYAFATYHQLTGNEMAFSYASQLFQLIEQHSRDREQGGFGEAYGRNWEVIADLRLSEKDANEAKTMNTHLHLLEAYTRLYQTSGEPIVSQALQELIRCFLDHFIDPATGHVRLFFDESWQLRSQIISYGHDIETSWLLTEALDALGTFPGEAKARSLALQMAEVSLAEGFDTDGGLFNELHSDGHLDTDKHWWPQAEAVIGCWNAWQLSGATRFQEAAGRSWAFIKHYLRDSEQGEWHWRVDRQGTPILSEDKAGPWKAPYHNGRMCMEMLRRIQLSEV